MKDANWTIDKIPSQEGKVVIVTGASSGIGLEAAKVLAQKKAHVVMAVRNMEKGALAKNNITNKNSDIKLELLELDLSDLNSVEKFCKEFTDKHSRLDLLINNAGVMIPPYSKTKDGFELQMGTNHLGHFALTGKLINILNQTKGSRIVNISSLAHRNGNIDFDDINWEKREYNKWKAYGDSKLANIYFTYLLKDKLKDRGMDILVSAAHPGWTGTNLGQGVIPLYKLVSLLVTQNIHMGTLPTLRAAIDEDVLPGDYFGPKGKNERKGYPIKVESIPLSHDKEKAKQLWEISEKMTKVTFFAD